MIHGPPDDAVTVYNRGMPQPTTRAPQAPPPAAAKADETVSCERCGAGMFRMHAVWRCPACGYKTDCCGW